MHIGYNRYPQIVGGITFTILLVLGGRGTMETVQNTSLVPMIEVSQR